MVGGCGRSGGAGGAAFALTLPLTTFLEIADDPGILDGYGPIAGALARQIARDAARLNPRTTTWRCVVVDDEHHTVLGVGRPVSTPKHDPPSRLADLVRRVHPFCVFPGCRIPAARCDIDHRVPYPAGATCSCNLQPLCRAHHRLKTAGLIAVHADPTDRTDHTERNNPTIRATKGPLPVRPGRATTARAPTAGHGRPSDGSGPPAPGSRMAAGRHQ